MTGERPRLFRAGWSFALPPAVLSTLAVFVFGSLGAGELPRVDFRWGDKVGHFVAFGFVQFTYLRALQFLRPKRPRKSAIVLAVVLASLVGGLLEIWQAFLPHRSAEWLDFVADSLGAAAVGLLTVAWSRRK